MKHPLSKIALSVCVFAATAVALELGLRIVGFERRPPDPISLWNPVEDRALDGGAGVFERDRDCLWRPRPGAELRGLIGGSTADGAASERINAAGFRGPPLARERTPGRLRVATLGDSSTFGMGVAYEDTYSARLAALLAERGVEAEVLNGGVVGYTVRQGLARYERDVAPYRPDVVVAAFGAINEAIADRYNDEDKLTMEFSRAPSRVASFLREHSRTLQLALWLAPRRAAGELPPPSQRRPHDPPRSPTMPPDMVPRVSLEPFEGLLLELERAVRADGARLVVVSMPRSERAELRRPSLLRYTRRITSVAEREGWPLVDARGLFRLDPQTTLLLDEYHPNPAGHARIAAALADALLDRPEAPR